MGKLRHQREDIQKTNGKMGDIRPTLQIITLYVKRSNTPLKRQNGLF